MKKLFCLLFTLLFYSNVFAMDQCYKKCDASKIFFKLSCFLLGRSDYLYLVNSDSVWLLRKKISLNEDLDILDKYYPRYSAGANTKELLFYYTPLMEAVLKGNLDIVKILLNNGADSSKKVKSDENINDNEIGKNTGYYGVCVLINNSELDEYLDKQKKEWFYGMPVVEMAKILSEDSSLGDQAVRQKIYDILKYK